MLVSASGGLPSSGKEESDTQLGLSSSFARAGGWERMPPPLSVKPSPGTSSPSVGIVSMTR